MGLGFSLVSCFYGSTQIVKQGKDMSIMVIGCGYGPSDSRRNGFGGVRVLGGIGRNLAPWNTLLGVQFLKAVSDLRQGNVLSDLFYGKE